jgi:hypothetical protein
LCSEIALKTLQILSHFGYQLVLLAREFFRMTIVRLNNCGGQYAKPGETLVAFGDASSTSIARAWMESDGLAHVAVVFGSSAIPSALVSPKAMGDPEVRRSCDTLLSVENLY